MIAKHIGWYHGTFILFFGIQLNGKLLWWNDIIQKWWNNIIQFQPDIDSELICVEIRRLIRFLYQKLAKSRTLNVIIGYHTILTRKTNNTMLVDTYCIATPLQLDIHRYIQAYIREFSPNRLVTLHLGAPLPGCNKSYVIWSQNTQDDTMVLLFYSLEFS